MNQNNKRGICSKLLLAGTAVFFYLPILYIIVFSFNDSRSLTKFGGFSLRWYEKMFADRALFDVYKNSLFAASMTAIFGTVFAYSTALVAGRRGEHRNLGKIPDCAGQIIQE